MEDYTVKLDESFLSDEATGESIVEDVKVCRVLVPDLPEPRHPVLRNPLTAVCCTFKYNKGWAFVTLSEDQKHPIGDALIAQEIPIGEWADVELNG